MRRLYPAAAQPAATQPSRPAERALGRAASIHSPKTSLSRSPLPPASLRRRLGPGGLPPPPPAPQGHLSKWQPPGVAAPHSHPPPAPAEPGRARLPLLPEPPSGAAGSAEAAAVPSAAAPGESGRARRLPPAPGRCAAEGGGGAPSDLAGPRRAGKPWKGGAGSASPLPAEVPAPAEPRLTRQGWGSPQRGEAGAAPSSAGAPGGAQQRRPQPRASAPQGRQPRTGVAAGVRGPEEGGPERAWGHPASVLYWSRCDVKIRLPHHGCSQNVGALALRGGAVQVRAALTPPQREGIQSCLSITKGLPPQTSIFFYYFFFSS